jgi:signal transduction histidine kinase
MIQNEPYQRDSDGYSLLINKKIMELHKGKIGVRSEGIGKGATFYIDIPSRLPVKHRSKSVEF